MHLLFLFLLGCALYFLPFLVANSRRHRNLGLIFLLNLFAGWTFIGWIVAMLWALSDDTNKHPRLVVQPVLVDPVHRVPQITSGFCSKCGAPLQGGQFCSHCGVAIAV